MIKEKNSVTLISFASFLEQKMNVETTATLFIVESEVEPNYLIGIIKKAISIGTKYFLAWGQNAEELHDIFDDVIISEQIEQYGYDYDPPLDKVIITTDHSGETAEEVVFFFYIRPGLEDISRFLILFNTEGQHIEAIKEQLDLYKVEKTET